jgi:hypothetical protein
MHSRGINALIAAHRAPRTLRAGCAWRACGNPPSASWYSSALNVLIPYHITAEEALTSQKPRRQALSAAEKSGRQAVVRRYECRAREVMRSWRRDMASV